MRTVLSIISTLKRCGPSDGVRKIAKFLDPIRYRAVVATLSREPSDNLLEDFKALGVPIVQLRLSRIKSLITGTHALRDVVSKVKPNLVHCHGFRADLLAAKSRLPCPVISTVHSDLEIDYGFAYGDTVGRYMARSEYAALRQFDGVTAVSQPLAEAIALKGIPTVGIPNGVDLNDFYAMPDPESAKGIRAKLGWPADSVIVLHTGVLRNLKCPIQVVRGFRSSKLSDRGFLVFAGDGPLRTQCERASAGASNIIFLGNRKDVAELLRAADILLSASSSEGLGTAIIEGCVTGLTVLATDIPAHRYIQKLFPAQLKLYGSGDAASVSKALDGLSIKPAKPRAPISSALMACSAQAMSEAYQNFYSVILDRSRLTSNRER